MIKCHIWQGNDEDVQKLSNSIERLVNKVFNDVQFSLFANRHYWKYPEDKEVIFKVSGTEPLKVINFISHITLSWEYKSGVAHDSETKEVFFDERATWHQYEDSEESFFLPSVNWVHVYTWFWDNVENLPLVE